MTDRHDALAELLALEGRLEAEVVATRTEAERRLATVREEAQRLACDEGESLGAALVVLRDAIARETGREIAGIEAETRAEVARHRDVDEQILVELARDVVDRLMAAGE